MKKFFFVVSVLLIVACFALVIRNLYSTNNKYIIIEQDSKYKTELEILDQGFLKLAKTSSLIFNPANCNITMQVVDENFQYAVIPLNQFITDYGACIENNLLSNNQQYQSFVVITATTTCRGTEDINIHIYQHHLQGLLIQAYAHVNMGVPIKKLFSRPIYPWVCSSTTAFFADIVEGGDIFQGNRVVNASYMFEYKWYSQE